MLVFLKNNLENFSWSTFEAPRIELEFMYHHLNVNPTIMPTRQQPQGSSNEHAEAVKEEVNKLKQARAIKEVFYPEWLASTIVVKKKLGK